jgi:hypothetical protein
LGGNLGQNSVIKGLEKQGFSKYTHGQMHKPIPTISFLSSFAALQAIANGSNAVSLEAHAVCKQANIVMNSFEQSQVLFGSKAAAISRLWNLAAETCPNEYGVLNKCAVLNTERFIRALPDSLPLPEFACEPDGSVSLDWIESRKQFFSISVGINDRLAFAWLDGTNTGHGVERFDGEQIPKRIIGGITAIVTNGNSFLRAA